MRPSFLNIDKILDIEKWQNLQDSLARVTKLAIITVDYKGVPITAHSEPRAFCQRVRSNPELVQFCQKCDSRGGLEAVRTNAPYIYLCHCNIVDIAVPIVIDGQYIGAAMAGQIHLPSSEQADELERIMEPPVKALLSDEHLLELYNDIPTLPYNEIKAVADMLFDLCSYVIQEAINKNLLVDMYEQMGAQRLSGHPVEIFSGYPTSSIEFAKRTMNNAITKSHIITADGDRPTCKNPILKPALDYIYENKGEAVTQKQMAALCHISTSHFSRLFAKEIGEGFSTFLARQKVEWSKQLLERTDLSVSQISDELGFSTPGYYIKTFKRYENTTPAIYRKYFQKNY